MSRTDVKTQYLDFLLNIIQGDRDYCTLLLKHLHRIEFYSIVPNDDNRGEDGKKLRTIFERETGHKALSLCLNGPCSILEMLIGLAFRISNELEGGKNERSVEDCFWMMVDNLNLTWVDNFAYFQDGGNDAIGENIEKFLDRKYDRNGNGGLFPLKKSKKDQRTVEIWYQMAEYLLENFDF